MDDRQLVLTHLPEARQLSAREGMPLFDALCRLLGDTRDRTLGCLGAVLGYPVWRLPDIQALAPDFSLLPYAEAVQRGLLFALDPAGELLMLLTDPFDAAQESWGRRRALSSGVQPRPTLVLPEELQIWLAEHEPQVRAMAGLDLAEGDGEMERVAAVITLASLEAEENPVVRLVSSTIYDALQMQASDIHLECDAEGLRVLYRLDGLLLPMARAPGLPIAEQAVSRIKVMAELDIAERRIPQDGRFKVRVAGREVDFRVSVMPSLFGEDAVLRLLDRQSLGDAEARIRLEDLGLDEAALHGIRRLSARPHGMLLVTGPTGSGKTTTLYAALSEVNTGQEKIVTIEDPVEYRLPQVLQIPVNEKKGLTFARGLRSILRHDPDKIMVGEIRDGETAQIAIQAALTGHLVFTTVHANNVFDVLGRFLHMGVDAYSFAAALNGIVAQRLLRLNCPHCTRDIEADPEALAACGLTQAAVAGWTLRAGRGCEHCRGIGYKGRRAVAEVLLFDDVLREMLATQAAPSAMRQHAERQGWRSLREIALDWVARGESSLAEVMRVAG